MSESGAWSELEARISRKVNAGLPGLTSHEKLVPPERRPHLWDPFPKNRKLAAVLTLLFEYEGYMSTLIIQRPTYPGVHSGQFAFPGGKVEEADRDFVHTALREAEEEVGIPQTRPKVHGELTRLYIPPSGFEVVPILGTLEKLPPLTLQPTEVQSTRIIKLKDLRKPGILREVPVQTRMGKVKVPAFILGNDIIWGATAMIINEIVELRLD
jgi:8-oxo-dGTP pyrophosphatase MutT (NUDIX family)